MREEMEEEMNESEEMLQEISKICNLDEKNKEILENVRNAFNEIENIKNVYKREYKFKPEGGCLCKNTLLHENILFHVELHFLLQGIRSSVFIVLTDTKWKWMKQYTEHSYELYKEYGFKKDEGDKGDKWLERTFEYYGQERDELNKIIDNTINNQEFINELRELTKDIKD
ncbi:MAG: hypothetical protein ATN35_00075 [Epulopiscium sp. Nele67-Bin004]|nr:MAG: hypothetical protein ATN35_00075 [Epulopiscium sp. Nele67-Bin004]